MNLSTGISTAVSKTWFTHKMALIILHTRIKAPVERCFLLSLSVDVHMGSTAQTREKAIAGVTSGVMQLNDTVTWRARHFGVDQELSSKITVCEKPYRFVDEMIKGPFKHICHEHLFEDLGNGEALMTDRFGFSAPLGFLGKIAEALFLKRYLKKFLVERNDYIRRVAESEAWKDFLPGTGGA